MTKESSAFPFLQYWYQPVRAARTLILEGRGHAVALVAAAVFGLVQSAPRYLAGESDLSVLISGALLGLLGIYLFGWLLRNFGRWFNKDQTVPQKNIRIALGLGLIPWSALFSLVLALLNPSGGPEGLGDAYLPIFAGFIYGYVILLLGLSVALELTVLKTFFCLIVTFMVSLFPLTLVAQLLAG